MNISDLTDIANNFDAENIISANIHLEKHSLALVTDFEKPMGDGVTHAQAYNWAQEVLNLSTPLLEDFATQMQATHIKPSRLIVRPT